jgi:ketosteroid isomerase-like protein
MSLPIAAADHPVAAARSLFVEALRAGDVTTACSIYADDAELFPPLAAALHGRGEICRYWQAGVDSGMSDISLESGGLFEQGDVAYETGRYRLRIAPTDRSEVVERGHYVQIHEHGSDGSWRRTVEIFSPGGGE